VLQPQQAARQADSQWDEGISSRDATKQSMALIASRITSGAQALALHRSLRGPEMVRGRSCSGHGGSRKERARCSAVKHSLLGCWKSQQPPTPFSITFLSCPKYGHFKSPLPASQHRAVPPKEHNEERSQPLPGLHILHQALLPAPGCKNNLF